MNSRIAACIFFCLIVFLSQAQTSRFGYRRKIEAVSAAGWYSITLPAAIAGYSSFDDLRILKITGDTTEIPYLLNILEDKTKETSINVPILNRSVLDGKLYMTFAMPENETANSLQLEFNESNFEGEVLIEGSNDQKKWFMLMDKRRILSVSDQEVDFRFTTVRFPLSNYRYLRAEISSNKLLHLASASLERKETTPGVALPVSISAVTTHHKEAKETVLSLSADQTQLMNVLSLRVNHDGDYYRPFRLDLVRDSVKGSSGWIYYYDRLASGYITSADSNIIRFSSRPVHKLRLTIFNADNQPLMVDKISAQGPQVVLLAKISPGDHFLFYGSNDRAPDYDLKYFEQHVPQAPPTITTEDETSVAMQPSAGSPLFEKKIWLWGVMIVLIGSLGFFTARMLRK